MPTDTANHSPRSDVSLRARGRRNARETTSLVFLARSVVARDKANARAPRVSQSPRHGVGARWMAITYVRYQLAPASLLFSSDTLHLLRVLISPPTANRIFLAGAKNAAKEFLGGGNEYSSDSLEDTFSEMNACTWKIEGNEAPRDTRTFHYTFIAK